MAGNYTRYISRQKAILQLSVVNCIKSTGKQTESSGVGLVAAHTHTHVHQPLAKQLREEKPSLAND